MTAFGCGPTWRRSRLQDITDGWAPAGPLARWSCAYLQARDLIALEPEREGERGRTALELAGHPGADFGDIVHLTHLQRLDGVLVLGFRFAPPRADGLATGIGPASSLTTASGAKAWTRATPSLRWSASK